MRQLLLGQGLRTVNRDQPAGPKSGSGSAFADGKTPETRFTPAERTAFLAIGQQIGLAVENSLP